MSGQRRLLRKGNRKPSLLAFELNFGLIAMVLLAALAITATLMFPDIPVQPAEFLAGP
jgi:tryptophan-rich sensory protein